MKILGLILAISVLCVPLAIAATVLCAPFWEWFEAATSVQAYGHHGPIEWCYLVTYGVLLAAACGWVLRMRGRG